jgi:DeoD family purine-nucleoside phosphorylase
MAEPSAAALPTVHLHPTAELADRVLLPGDPGRALALAQQLLEAPRMFNHHRGLWGYTGAAPDGAALSIQATGMGGPSAAIVVEELIALGARELIRVGTCGALDPGLALGDLVVAREALAADGASRALGAGERVAADATLTGRLVAAGAGPAGLVVSTDLFYEPRPGLEDEWRAAGAIAVEMETAALLQVAALRGVRAAAVFVVSDTLAGGRARIGEEELAAAVEALGRAGLAGLSGDAPGPRR